MKFEVKSGDIAKNKDCLILGVYEKGELTSHAKHFNKLSKNFISKILKNSECDGSIGQTLDLYHVPGISVERVMLVGCGKNKPLSDRDYRRVIASAVTSLKTSKAEDAAMYLTELPIEKYDLAWKIKQAVDVTRSTLYTFLQFKSVKCPPCPLKNITLYVDDKSELKNCETALKQAIAIADGAELTKNLANLPSNICTPEYVANEAKRLAKEYKSISIKILEKKDMEKLGMGAFLAVAKGSNNDPKLVCLEYTGAGKKAKKVALVGKGITFDTGGLSLKPADSMVGMKYDMCGSATVLGTFKAAATLKLPINLVGILALAENMPSGVATKPEDIVTTMSGQTVEIMNTDAEGRLVLCDALTYCERYNPDVVIDIATLTGAVVVALGHHATGLLSNYEPLAQELLEAGQESHDRAWQLPLWEDYQELLKSPFADMSNVGGRYGGTISAACFLSRFTKKFHWAHLDVAGTAAMMGGVERFATGRPVPMLMQYLLNQCG